MIYRTTPFLWSLFLLFCLSCREKGRETEKNISREKPVEIVEIIDNSIVQLTPEAKTETSQWLAFITAQSEVADYRKYGAEYAAQNASATLQIMQNLQQTLPQKFKITPVEARINVLITLAHTLKQESGNQEPNRKKIAEIAQKIPIAFDNLKIQVNEVFAKPLEEFQEELGNESDSLSTLP